MRGAGKASCGGEVAAGEAVRVAGVRAFGAGEASFGGTRRVML